MEKRDILYAIYCSKTGMNVFDLLYENDLQYSELKPCLDEWVAQKFLRTEDGKHYVFIGDGRMFSGKYKKERLKRFTKELIRRSVNEEWDRLNDAEEAGAEKDTDDEILSEEDSDSYENWRSSPNNATDLNDSAYENEDDDSQTDDELCKCILDCMRESIGVNKQDDRCFIEIDGIDLFKTDAKFELLPCDEKVYLCDQGATLCSLEETVEADDELRDRMANIAEECGAEFVDGKLCVEVVSAEQTLCSLFRLYAAMEHIARIGGVSRKKIEQNDVPKEYIEALEYVISVNKAGIIDLHAEFGFAPHEIGLMFEWMEEEGFITPFDESSGKRKVLLTMEEFERRFGKK